MRPIVQFGRGASAGDLWSGLLSGPRAGLSPSSLPIAPHWPNGAELRRRVARALRGLACSLCAGSASALLLASPALAEEGGGSGGRFELYKPTYFVSGYPDTKIELSFKFRVIPSLELYFAYSQLMMWELFSSDPRFRDINYAPEALYRLRLGAQSWLDISFFEHESNGTGGADERSWNRSALRFHSEESLGRATLRWSLTGWVAYIQGDHTPDMMRYRGVWEVNATLAGFLGPLFPVAELTLRAYPGGRFYVNAAQGGQ